MGYNKAFADIGGKNSLQMILEKFQTLFEETLIVTNEPSLYEGMADQVVRDVFPGLGPVAGIHSALYHARHDSVFLLGCDMPFMSMELAAYLLNRGASYQAAVPKINGCLQPLAAVYHQSCLPAFQCSLQEDRLKLMPLLDNLNALFVDESELTPFGPLDEIFLNVNDSAALEKARLIAGRLG